MYLHMEIFGYEDLLFELAKSGIKVQLNDLQKLLVEDLKQSDLFRYDGDPDVKVFARCSEQRAFEIGEYKT